MRCAPWQRGVRGRPVTLRFDAIEYWEKPQILCATAPEIRRIARSELRDRAR